MISASSIKTFSTLLYDLNELCEDQRADFLMQLGIEKIADALVEDAPKHFTLLKRIMELLTLVPIEERYLVEEIATTANSKYTEHSYNQFGLFNNSDDAENVEESDFPSPA